MTPIRIVIVDDSPDLREMLKMLLGGPLQIVGEAADGVEALEVVRSTTPDIVLMDANMPRMGGTDATRLIRREFPEVKVLGFTASGPECATELMEAGCIAVFEKTAFGDLLQSLQDLTVIDSKV